MEAASSYDEVFFQSRPGPERHIGRLSVVGRLFGLTTADITRCRAAEFGCSTGINLIPQALVFPESRFVGIDSSEKQIRFGQELAHKLGLSNIQLQCKDLRDASEKEEGYDYLIVHGLYSWGGKDLQSEILAAVRRALNPGGVAYISFNVLPGWESRRAVRELLLSQDSSSDSSGERITRARAYLRTLAEQASEAGEEFLSTSYFHYASQSDGFILHELLAPWVEACTLQDFTAQASLHQLKYVGDGHPPRMTGLERASPDKPREYDRVFFDGKADEDSRLAFRGALLCREEESLLAYPDPSRLMPCYLASPLVALEEAHAVVGEGVSTFIGPEGSRIEMRNLAVKFILSKLQEEWPRALSYEALLAEFQKAHPFTASSLNELEKELLGLFAKNLLEYHFTPLICVRELGNMPRVSACAREQATFLEWVTNARHEVVDMGEFEKKFILFLDGKRTLQSVYDELLMQEKALASSLEAALELPSLLSARINSALHQFIEKALIIGENSVS